MAEWMVTLPGMYTRGGARDGAWCLTGLTCECKTCMLTSCGENYAPVQSHPETFPAGATAAAPDAREQYLIALMAPPNGIWDSIIQQAVVNPDVLKQQEVIKSLQNVLQVGVYATMAKPAAGIHACTFTQCPLCAAAPAGRQVLLGLCK
jgi:hypothetical protein